MGKKKLPFQIKLIDVSEINPRAGFEDGEIYDVWEETREGYMVMSESFGMTVEILFGECERVVPEIEDRKEKDGPKKES